MYSPIRESEIPFEASPQLSANRAGVQPGTPPGPNAVDGLSSPDVNPQMTLRAQQQASNIDAMDLTNPQSFLNFKTAGVIMNTEDGGRHITSLAPEDLYNLGKHRNTFGV